MGEIALGSSEVAPAELGKLSGCAAPAEPCACPNLLSPIPSALALPPLPAAAAKSSGETVVLCGPLPADGSRLRAALDCEAAVQLPHCMRPCEPGAPLQSLVCVCACFSANKLQAGRPCTLLPELTSPTCRAPAGVPLSLNVSDGSQLVSITPALRRPEVDGVRVEVNGQARYLLLVACAACCRRACSPVVQALPACAGGGLVCAALPPSMTRAFWLPCLLQVLSRGGDVAADQLEDTTAAQQQRRQAACFLACRRCGALALVVSLTCHLPRSQPGHPARPAAPRPRASALTPCNRCLLPQQRHLPAQRIHHGAAARVHPGC